MFSRNFKKAIYKSAVSFIALSLFSIWNISLADVSRVKEAGLSLSYSSNVDLNPEESAETALTIATRYFESLRINEARYNALLSANISFESDLIGPDSLNINQTIRGFGTATIIPDFLSVEANISSTRELRDQNAAVSANESSGRDNFRTVNSFEISPDFERLVSLGPYAFVSANYSERRNLLGGSDENDSDETNNNDDNSNSRAGSVSINSGRHFSRLNFSQVFSYNITTRNQNQETGDLTQETTVIKSFISNYGYRVSPILDLNWSVGLESNQSSDGNLFDTEGLTWDIGFTYRPLQEMTISFTRGNRFGGTTYNGSIFYRLSSYITLQGSVSDTLDTVVRTFNEGLVGVDPFTGELIDIQSGLPLDFNDPNFGIQDEISRNRTISGTVSMFYRRNNLSLSTSIQRRKFEFQSNSSTRNLNVNYSRTVNNRTDFSAFSSYRVNKTDSPTIPQSTTLSGGLNYSYQRNSKFSVRLSASHSRRLSPLEEEKFKENAFSISLILNL